jgi:hypothetical protein
LEALERVLQSSRLKAGYCAAENDMKIYLLMLLMGTLLTAIRFTSARERQSKSLPQ